MTGAHGAVFLIWQVLTVPPADEPELSEWADAVETTYLASLLPSWLLIDAVKVGIATALSSEAALLALGTAEQPEEGSLEAGLRRRRAAKAKAMGADDPTAGGEAEVPKALAPLRLLARFVLGVISAMIG